MNTLCVNRWLSPAALAFSTFVEAAELKSQEQMQDLKHQLSQWKPSQLQRGHKQFWPPCVSNQNQRLLLVIKSTICVFRGENKD